MVFVQHQFNLRFQLDFTVFSHYITKTDCSMRTLPLCPYTYQYFQNLRQQQFYYQELCGNNYEWRFTDFVCVDKTGCLIQPDYITHKFPQILKKYNLRPIRFHDLRHPYVKPTTKKFTTFFEDFRAAA